MEVLTILVMGLMGLTNIACFVIGANVGQKASKGEEIKMPSVNPIAAARAHEAKKEAEFEQSRIDAILRNVECFDGTEYGQVEVPRG